MNTFTVNAENQIALAAEPKDAENADAQLERFVSQAELTALTATWPAARLLAVWNSLPGVAPVKRFTDRKTAVRRIWEAVQTRCTGAGPERPEIAPKARREDTLRNPAQGAATGRKTSKSGQILRLLKRSTGATLAELIEVTSWQPHTVRGFISGALGKRMRIPVESSRREDGARVYRIRA